MSGPARIAAVLLALAPAAASADTLYRCVTREGAVWVVNAARRHSGWVEFKKCTPIDQRPHADPRGAKCSVVRYGKTLIRRCEKDGLVVATSLVEPKAARPAAAGTAAARGTPQAGGEVESIAEQAGGIEGIEAIVAAASAAEGIPEPLLRAVIMVESGFRPDVVSPAGAQGLMQLMPLTADSLDVDDPFDPKQNVMAGARFLRQLSDRFHGDVERVVAAYYAGPTAVARHGGIPDSCAPYVRKVLALYRKYAGVPGASSD